VLALVPTPPQMEVRFMTRRAVIDIRHPNGEPPQQYIARVFRELDAEWRNGPDELTPAREAVQAALQRARGRKVLTYFACDGVPNGGNHDVEQIKRMLATRPNPQDNPWTFWACSDEDGDVEWMKECEEASPFCSEADDFNDESDEIRADQGAAFPFSFGLYLVSEICAACFPEDLDTLDESAPMPRGTLETLMGYAITPQDYQHYFREFMAAQRKRQVGTSAVDRIKLNYREAWPQHEAEFFHAASSRDIPVVVKYRQAVREAEAVDSQRRLAAAAAEEDCCDCC
jgi:hypothetical protein